MWVAGVRAGWYHRLSPNSTSNGGGVTTAVVGDVHGEAFYVPPSRSWEITKCGVYNADTVTDANMVVRLGLYKMKADLTSELVADFGTIGKDTTATTTVRQVGSSFSYTLGPDQIYIAVSQLEVARVGLTSGFASIIGGTSPWWNPVGALLTGTPPASDDANLVGTGSGSSGQPLGWPTPSVATGGFPSTLPIPTTVSPRGIAQWFYVNAETAI